MQSRYSHRVSPARQAFVRPAAFTLVELLLVLVILAVLAAVVIPKFTGRSEQARVAAAKTGIASIRTALNAFEIDTGRYPTTEEGLQALITQPGDLKGWNSRGYLERSSVPVDPWGHPYQYASPGSHSNMGYDLFSCGADGREGTDDDVTSWSD